VHTTDLSNWQARLTLTQYPNNLAFRKFRPPHPSSPKKWKSLFSTCSPFGRAYAISCLWDWAPSLDATQIRGDVEIAKFHLTKNRRSLPNLCPYYLKLQFLQNHLAREQPTQKVEKGQNKENPELRLLGLEFLEGISCEYANDEIKKQLSIFSLFIFIPFSISKTIN